MADGMDMNAAFAAAVSNQREANASAANAEAEAVERLNKRYGDYVKQVEQASRRNEQLRRGLKDGTFSRHAAELNKVNKEYAQLQHQAKLQEMVAQHGRLGGVIRAHQNEFAAMKRAGVNAFGTVNNMAMSLMRSGLQGTVEGYRMEMAWTRLARQVAGIAIPAIDMVSKTVGRVATWFEKLSGNQQDVILKFGLMAMAAGPVLRIVSGIGAALAGAGAIAGSARVAAGLSAAGAGAAAGAAGGAAASGAGVSGGVAAAAGASRLGRAAGLVGKVGGALAVGDAVQNAIGGDYYNVLRSRGQSRIAAGLGALGGGFMNTISRPLKWLGATDKTYDEAFTEKYGTGAPAESGKRHRDPALNQTSLLELGSTAQLLQEEVLKVSMAREENDSEAITGIYEMMKTWHDSIVRAVAPPMSTG